MTLDQKKQEARALLDSLKMYMKPDDIRIVSDEIDAATSTYRLGYTTMGLRFHRFRVNDAIKRGELVEVK